MCLTSKLTSTVGAAVCVVVGGYDKKAWAFNKDDFSGRGFNTTSKNLETFVIAVTKKGYSATGRKDKNTAGATAVVSPSGITWNHSVSLKFFHDNQIERNAINEFVKAEELIVFMLGNDNVIEVFGLNKGLNTVSAAYVGGTLQSDEKSTTVSKEGLDLDMPWIFRSATASTLEDDIAYLNAKLITQT